MSALDPKLSMLDKAVTRITITRAGSTATLPTTITVDASRIKCVGGIERVSIQGWFSSTGTGQDSYEWPITEGLLMSYDGSHLHDTQGLGGVVYKDGAISGKVDVVGRRVQIVISASGNSYNQFHLNLFVLKEV